MLDLTTLLPGPLATLMLAEAGADVLKVEPPGGEDMRRVPPMRGGVSMLFTMLNRGKRGIELDLKAPAGKAALEALVREADVLVEQFRPGVLARLGFGAERLSELNPGLITCAITGYGQEGPRRDEPGHDLNYISQTGLLAMSPGTREAPTLPPALIADIAGGSFPAVINILLALRLRDRTGKGQHIDVAMTDAMFTLAFWGLAMLEDSGAAPRPGAELFSGALPRYRLYPAACGRLVAVGALEDKFWIRFADLIELPKNLREDHVDPEATAREVARLIAAKPASHWQRVFAGHDCCAGVVRRLDEAVADPHFIARGLFAARVGSQEGQGGEGMALPVPVSAAMRTAPQGCLPAPVDLIRPDGVLSRWPAPEPGRGGDDTSGADA